MAYRSVKILPIYFVMKISFIRQVIILALLIFFVGLIHIWDLPKNLEAVEVHKESAKDLSAVQQQYSQGVTRDLAGDADSEIRQIDCKNLTDLYVKHLRLRLEGKCQFELSTITNKTNGYTASIFNRENSFTTDYISLSAGKNFIEINYKDEKKQDILRQVPVIVAE